MAIYRGAGGAGDATADAASEASLIKTLAVEVQADADAAEAARAAAVVAKNAAELAETNAETAETNAETAEANAETAQAAAEAAQAAAATSATNAANSATAAQTAETNAETAETNAAASASAASTSATNAASSASSASASASTATTQATNASNSASAAATSATNASNSASAAATSATNAATSATSASNSASTATTQATNAANSATAAATSATNSANSATASASSATDSAASATLANDWATKTSAPVAGGEYSAKYHAQQSATSATNSSNSASSAATSATNASNSATASASSASDAAASAAAAAASYDNFDDRYLGSKSSAPTLDNDGNALLTGALYYNNGTVTPADKGMYVYDGSQWIAASAASTAILTVYKYTATAGQTTFSGNDDNAVSLVYTAGSVIITLNGAVLEIPVDVAASTGTSVVLANAAVAGDELNIYAFATFNVANTYTQAQSDATFLTKSNPSYTGTLTGGTGVVNIGSGQVYKDASGNVGIGTTSTSGYKLAVSDGTTFSVVHAGGGASYYGAITNNPVLFITNNTERMRIDSSGKLLVGTATGGTFDMARIQGANSIANDLTLIGANTSQVRINFGDTDAASVGEVGYDHSTNAMRFVTNGSERMRIDSSGNLLVGTTTSLYSTRLTAAGTSAGGPAAEFRVSANNLPEPTTYFIKNDNNTTTSNVFCRFVIANGGGASGQINANGASSAAFGTWSDQRLKTNIENLPTQLSNICSLRPVEFDYIQSEGGGHQIGFIAQEMQEVYPDAVGERSDGMLTLTGWDKTTARLVKAIQEQQAIITDLRTELDSLKSEVTALKGQA